MLSQPLMIKVNTFLLIGLQFSCVVLFDVCTLLRAFANMSVRNTGTYYSFCECVGQLLEKCMSAH